MSSKTEKENKQTDFVYLTWFYVEKTNKGSFLRSELRKIARSEYEEKFAMR